MEREGEAEKAVGVTVRPLLRSPKSLGAKKDRIGKVMRERRIGPPGRRRGSEHVV